MFSKTSVPFLSLSEDVQLMIYNKMTNAELIRTSSLSSVANKVVSNNSRTLSSRPHIGDKLMLMATMNEIYIRHGLFKDFLKVDTDFHKHIAGISISTLEINILDKTQILNVLEFLKVWRPICDDVEFFGRLPASSILEMSECVRIKKTIKMISPDEDFNKMVPILNKAYNCRLMNVTFQSRQLTSSAARNLEGTDVFGQMKHFGEFHLSATIPTVVKFLWDLKKASEIGNFKEASLSIPFPEQFDSFPYLFPSKRIPPTEVLFSAPRGQGEVPLTIEKLTLQNGMCAIVQGWDRNPRMIIKVIIMKDEGKEIQKVIDLSKLSSRIPGMRLP